MFTTQHIFRFPETKWYIIVNHNTTKLKKRNQKQQVHQWRTDACRHKVLWEPPRTKVHQIRGIHVEWLDYYFVVHRQKVCQISAFENFWPPCRDEQELSYRRESRLLRLFVTGRQTTSIYRHGPKKMGRAAVPLWVGGAGLLLMFSEYLYHQHYGGDKHFLNVPSSLRRPVSSQVSSKYILSVTYLLSYF